jgi:hypothetical protein
MFGSARTLGSTLVLALVRVGNLVGKRGFRIACGVHPLRETDLICIKVDISREEMSDVDHTQAVYS